MSASLSRLSLQRATRSIHSLSRTNRSLLLSSSPTAVATCQFRRAALSRLRVSAVSVRNFSQTYVTAQEKQQPSLKTTEPLNAPGASRQPKDNKLKVWPFIAIFLVGAVAFATVLDNRKDKPKLMPALQPQQETASKELPKLRDDGPIFSPSDVKVIFVLGGPGVGKGTQCAKLVKDYDFVHLSAGDLLREEQSRSGTAYGELIKSYIREGLIVPMEVTIVLLENAMKAQIDQGRKRFLVDGFPRQMDQAVKFEEVIVPSAFTLFFDCDEDTMTKRLIERGKTSGRADDNPESILKRFRTFKETSMPVVNYFDGQKKVVKVDAGKSIDAVYKDVVDHVASRLK